MFKILCKGIKKIRIMEQELRVFCTFAENLREQNKKISGGQ